MPTLNKTAGGTALKYVDGSNIQYFSIPAPVVVKQEGTAIVIQSATARVSFTLASLTQLAGTSAPGTEDAAMLKIAELFGSVAGGSSAVKKSMLIPILANSPGGSGTTASHLLTNIAAAATEMASPAYRTNCDTSNLTEFRIVAYVSTAGNAGSVIRVKYAGTSAGPFTDVLGADISLATTGLKTQGWTALPGSAIGDEWFTVETQGGDGVADPRIGYLHIEVR
jgi:hypothetical protein